MSFRDLSYLQYYFSWSWIPFSELLGAVTLAHQYLVCILVLLFTLTTYELSQAHYLLCTCLHYREQGPYNTMLSCIMLNVLSTGGCGISRLEWLWMKQSRKAGWPSLHLGLFGTFHGRLNPIYLKQNHL